jgi:predicted phosphodiesterase
MRAINIYSGLINSLFVILFVCCVSRQSARGQLAIAPLHPYEEINTVGNHVQKYKFFIVNNFQEGSKEQIKQIDNYIKGNMDKDHNKYSQYIVVIYKESDKLNKSFKQTESDMLMWHGKDVIYTFQWDQGVFSFYTIHKNGALVKTVFPE